MKKLAIIGASYLQKPLVLKAREMGIETHVFAWEEGAVCKEIADHFYSISILEKELILQKCTEIGIDGITSIASDAAVPTVCFVAEKMGLISNRFGDSLVATNKYEMRKRFMHQDVKCPRFEVATADNLPDVSNFRFPVIVKPTDRSGSRGVLKIEHPKQLKEAVSRAQTESFSGEAIVEEFVQGREVSVESISWEGKHYILAITDKVTTGEPYFVEDIAFNERIENFKIYLTSVNVSVDDVCGAGSTPLNVAALRQSDDFDYLSIDSRCDISDEVYSPHDDQLPNYPYSKEEIITNPDYHFYYHGLKFISLEVLYKFKYKRAEKPKDFRDCRLIRKFQRKIYFNFAETIRLIKEVSKKNTVLHFMLRCLRKVKRIYRKLFNNGK